MAREYIERVSNFPPKEIFCEFFTVFTDSTENINANFLEKMELCNNYKESVAYLNGLKPLFKVMQTLWNIVLEQNGENKMSIKKKIKAIMPDKLVYLYQVFCLIPKYFSAKKKSLRSNFPNVKFMDDKTTVDKIVNERMSLSRFGDGEFMWMSGEHLNSFQDYSEQFAQDLREAFQSSNSRLLVGIPYGLFDSKECNLYARMYWEIIKQDFMVNLIEFVDLNKVYCNASITRPYIDYKKHEYSENAFNNLKRIWNNRDVVIVEGEKTKLGMGNDLFDNALSIKRILCPAVNAYDKIEAIKSSVRKNVSKQTMLLGALGPTASILAAQFTEEGYQFVDIGHIDIEYMWYLKKATLRVPIEGKYVNESGEKECSQFYDCNQKYIDSIIDKIV